MTLTAKKVPTVEDIKKLWDKVDWSKNPTPNQVQEIQKVTPSNLSPKLKQQVDIDKILQDLSDDEKIITFNYLNQVIDILNNIK